MTRDDEYNVQQDNPVLVSMIRQLYLQENHRHFKKNNPLAHPNFIELHQSTPMIAQTIASYVDMKKDGYFIQSLTDQSGVFQTAPWLAQNLNWGGLIIEPEARKYFSLCKENAMRPKIQIIQACVSTNTHPKEVKIILIKRLIYLILSSII